MPSMIGQLSSKGLIRPPSFLADNVMYETQMGSTAYGVATDRSDFDIYGFAIPPRDHLFPHLAGEIAGFGDPRPRRADRRQVRRVLDRVGVALMYDRLRGDCAVKLHAERKPLTDDEIAGIAGWKKSIASARR